MGSTKSLNLRHYWKNWFWLLLLTIAMIIAGSLHLSRIAVASLLLAGMAAKGSIILASFMHMSKERGLLVALVVGSILFIGISLFLGIAYDAASIARLSN